VRTLEASYSRPYLAHASISPSCAVALFQHGQLTVWTHSQGEYPLRRAIAAMLHIPETQVRCIHREGADCYGQNGADDAAADAALLARAFPEWPVRAQWMREQEQEWEPYGPAKITRVRGGLDGSGRIVDWQSDVWSNTHATRPGPPGVLLAHGDGGAVCTPFAAPIRCRRVAGPKTPFPLFASRARG
jgi:CO/xanthine dehydrogenase Mo-binding subunit